VNYALCDQTVTVYRLRDGQVQRQVLENCGYSWQNTEVDDELGCRRETKCLLILPGEEQTIFPGDRVFDGVGPAVTAARWAEFVPVLVPTLAEVAYVMPVRLGGQICHWEAGRK